LRPIVCIRLAMERFCVVHSYSIRTVNSLINHDSIAGRGDTTRHLMGRLVRGATYRGPPDHIPVDEQGDIVIRPDLVVGRWERVSFPTPHVSQRSIFIEEEFIPFRASISNT
jgi:hypothetical protein